MGSIFMAHTVIFIFGSFAVGQLSDRFGRFKCKYVVGGMVILATAFIIIGPSPILAPVLKV
jgi:MFS family permease